MNDINRESESTNEIRFSDLWNVIKNYYRVVITMTSVITVATIIYSLNVPPTYTSSVTMVDAESEETKNIAGITGLSQLIGGGTSQETTTRDVNLAILFSRKFLENFILESNMLIELFSDEWDSTNKVWKNDFQPRMWDAYNIVRRNIFSYETANTSGMIVLQTTWRDPILVAEWANGLVATVNEHIRNEAITDARASINFLNQELENTTLTAAEDSIFKLIEEQTKAIMLANVREEYAFKVIDPAVVPLERSAPNRTEMTVQGFIFGLFISALTAIALNILRKRKKQ